MTQALRIENDPAQVLAYIRDYNYPNKIWLDEPWMMDFTISLRILDESGTVGFIWAHWVDDGILSAHVGTLPGLTVDWHQLSDKMMTIADFLGADEIGLSFDGVDRAKALGRLVTRLGFIHDPLNPYGIQHFYRRTTHGRYLQSTQASQTP